MEKRFPIEDQIDMLASALKGRVVTPKHADYDAIRLTALANHDTMKPAAVIRVASAADVAAVLNFAQATDLQVSIRSGGHSTVGYGTNHGGLVIDVRDLNGIDIDAKAMTVWAGTGLTSGEVTVAVEQHGLIVGFGDSATVGIGGLTLGGGMGYMVRKHGLTIDCLLAAEIVTAAGDILIADATSHPDLFWALRGGGGNFGVVTRLKFQAHPLPAFVGGPLVLPATAEVIAGFAAACAAAPDELSAIGLVMPLPPVPFVPAEMHGKLVFIGMMAYAGDMAAAQPVLAPFRALATPIADLVRPAPYSSLYMMDPPADMRPMLAIRSRYVNHVGRDEAESMIAAIEACDAPMKMAQIRVLGGAFGRVPSNATAFGHRDAKIMVAFLSMYGGGPDVVARQERWAVDALAALQPGNGGAYVNFLAKEGHDGLRAAYPAATWDRLRQVKRTYDPENIFRLNQNIPPAV
jgi:FAD/FMN-containing dehydrogenase